MKITVCIGSGCHVKGSRRIIDRLQQLIVEYQVEAVVNLEACFCQGRCTEGVVVKVDDQLETGVTFDRIEEIFLTKLAEAKQCGHSSHQ